MIERNLDMDAAVYVARRFDRPEVIVQLTRGGERVLLHMGPKQAADLAAALMRAATETLAPDARSRVN